MENVARITRLMEAKLAGANAELAKFQERFAESPVYALEWSQNAFDAAALAQAASFALAVINETEGEANKSVPGILRQEFEARIRHAALYPSRSSSATANLIEQSKAKAAAEILDALK